MDELSGIMRNVDWIQWGQRHQFIGPAGLVDSCKINLHVCHVSPSLPDSLLGKTTLYRRSHILHKAASFFSFHSGSIDYDGSKYIERFHREVVRSIRSTDVLYSLANYTTALDEIDAKVRIHDQVGCLVTLAEISNTCNGTCIDLASLYEKEKRAFRSADLVICPSEPVSDYVKGILPSTKTKVIKYPVKEFDTKFINIFGAGVHALFVGRVEAAKGFLLILQLARIFKNITFHCVGPILMKINDLPKNLILYGKLPRNKIASFYSSASFLIFPSLSEGSATVTQEAMAYGLPGVVSYQSGSHYVHNESGFILDCKDTAGFIDCINAILADPHLLGSLRDSVIKESRKYSVPRYQNDLIHAINAL